MRYMNLVVLSKVWETVQAIAEKHEELSASCHQPMLGIGSDDVKNRCFCSLWVSWRRAVDRQTFITNTFQRSLEGLTSADKYS